MAFGKKLVLGSVAAVVVLIALLVAQSQKDLMRRSFTGDAPVVLDQVSVYCAAGIKTPVLQAAKEFEQQYSVKITMNYGGSGALLSTLRIAKQGDLYVAGDESYTLQAYKKGIVAEQLPLARMHPVIAVAKGNPKGIRSVHDLYRSDIRLSLGNPGATAIGKQTKKALVQAGVWEKVQAQVVAKGVFKPTVPEVANDLKIGAVDAVVIWDATARQYADFELVQTDEFDAMEKKVTVGVLSSSKAPTLALRFARFLNSKKGNVIFNQNGFTAVQGDAWAWKPEITFFCGSVSRAPLREVLRKFQKREGVVINTKYNGCGILTADMKVIKQGAGGDNFPDLYLACDRYYLENVKDWFQESVEVSDTDIVIVVPKGNPAGITGLRDLAKQGMRLSVGQCEQCTIGALTKIMLQREDLYDAVMKNVKVQTASSSMLVPTVVKTKNMTSVLDATLAYRVDTKDVANQVDVIEIHSVNATAVQPLSISIMSKYKYLSRRFRDAVLAAEEAYVKRGFHFRGGKALSVGTH